MSGFFEVVGGIFIVFVVLYIIGKVKSSSKDSDSIPDKLDESSSGGSNDQIKTGIDDGRKFEKWIWCKVCLHLIENIQNIESPEPFILFCSLIFENSEGEVKHIPLNSLNTTSLDELKLSMIKKCLAEFMELSQKIRWLKGRTFNLQTFTHDDVRDFLKNIDAMKESGLEVRVPDWWSDKIEAVAEDGKNIVEVSSTLTMGDTNDSLIDGPDLKGKNFKTTDLSNQNLKRADLEGANLYDANLNGANLELANLKNADLRHAKLNAANLKGANLKLADLKNANLYDANLNGANLELADLTNVNLYDANLNGANLELADLTNVNLMHAKLEGANLKQTKLILSSLSSADLEDADLQYADLRYADLYGARFKGADLTGVNFSGVEALTSAKFARSYGDCGPQIKEIRYSQERGKD